MKKEKTLQNLVLIIYLIFNIYYSYRYIFKYNSEGTSPTYSNTPWQFQIAKYIIAILFIFVILMYLLINRVTIKIGFVEIFLALGAVFILAKSLLHFNFDFLIKNYIFILPAYAIMFVKDENFKNRFIKLNKYILYYHILYSFIQILMYLIFDRLPALAYAGALVRFGGAWDDPNAFALYLILPIGYLICRILQDDLSKIGYVKHYALLIICLLLEILTFSFSGYLCLALAMIFIIVRYYKSNLLWINVFVAVLILSVAGLLIYDKIFNLIIEKSESLGEHLEQMLLKVTADNFVLGLFFGDSVYNTMESYYAAIFSGYGILYFLLVICLEIYLFYISYTVYKKNHDNILYFLAYVFINIFNICQFALPYALIFPVNYIYWLLIFFVLKEYREMGLKKYE